MSYSLLTSPFWNSDVTSFWVPAAGKKGSDKNSGRQESAPLRSYIDMFVGQRSGNVDEGSAPEPMPRQVNHILEVLGFLPNLWKLQDPKNRTATPVTLIPNPLGSLCIHPPLMVFRNLRPWKSLLQINNNDSSVCRNELVWFSIAQSRVPATKLHASPNKVQRMITLYKVFQYHSSNTPFAIKESLHSPWIPWTGCNHLYALQAAIVHLEMSATDRLSVETTRLCLESYCNIVSANLQDLVPKVGGKSSRNSDFRHRVVKARKSYIFVAINPPPPPPPPTQCGNRELCIQTQQR